MMRNIIKALLIISVVSAASERGPREHCCKSRGEDGKGGDNGKDLTEKKGKFLVKRKVFQFL